MTVGIPKEVKIHEYRVAATPDAVRDLVDLGQDLVVEHGAGEASSFSDDDYAAAGAQIAGADEAWASDLVLKIKEPQAAEYGFLRANQVLFTYLHLAADRALTEALMTAGTTAIAYETVRTADGGLPLLAPMSEVAGQLAVQAGISYLQRPLGGRGVLAGSIPGVSPARIVIVGGGVVGYHAAVVALGVGAQVQLFDTSLTRLRQLDQLLGGRIELLASSPTRLTGALADADLVIGAVLIPGATAPKVITTEMVRGMKAGSVICDVAIDQGGCCETSRATSYADPVYFEHGVTHYCVANLPGAVPVTSTLGLTTATAPYVRSLCLHGWREALVLDPALAAGLNVCGGELVCPEVAEAFALPHRSVADLLADTPLGV